MQKQISSEISFPDSIALKRLANEVHTSQKKEIFSQASVLCLQWMAEGITKEANKKCQVMAISGKLNCV